MQVNSNTGVVTKSYEPPADASPQQQVAGCMGCRQTRDSHLASIVGASAGGGLAVLLAVAAGVWMEKPCVQPQCGA